MIIRPIARNTTAPAYTCAPENPYCLSTQRESTNNNTSSPATTTTNHSPLLTHRNLVGVLIIAALLALGLILWLCFGRWSKPIRHFLRGESRQNNNVRFGIGAGLASINHRNGAVTSKQQSTSPGSQGNDNAATDSSSDDVEKVGIVGSSSSSQSLLDDKDKETTKAKLEPAPPAKVRRSTGISKASIADAGVVGQVLHAFTIKSGSQLARLGG